MENVPARLLEKVQEFAPSEEKAKRDDTESIIIIKEEEEKTCKAGEQYTKMKDRTYFYK